MEVPEAGRSSEDLIMSAPQITVLIVEDEALIRLALAEQLHERGYKTVEAENATEAINLLESSDRIGAVFADIELPGSMNGLLLARYISKRWPEIIIIMNSGRAEPVADQMPLGTIFLPKPRRMMDMQRAYTAIELAASDVHSASYARSP